MHIADVNIVSKNDIYALFLHKDGIFVFLL